MNKITEDLKYRIRSLFLFIEINVLRIMLREGPYKKYRIDIESGGDRMTLDTEALNLFELKERLKLSSCVDKVFQISERTTWNRCKKAWNYKIVHWTKDATNKEKL